jgi:hypothetical protein
VKKNTLKLRLNRETLLHLVSSEGLKGVQGGVSIADCTAEGTKKPGTFTIVD